MAPRVLISDALSPAAVQIFRDRGVEVDFQPSLGKDKDRLAEIIGEFDGLAVRSATKVTAKMLERAARLKVIGRAGIGVDNVDIPAATGKGIIVMNTPFGNSITTAEHAITLMLALARQIPQADSSTQAGKWEKNRFMGVEITGKTLGVIGCGNIGSIVADRAIGLKMKVIAYDPFLSPDRAIALGVEKVDLAELIRRADFITLHTPLTDKTRDILGAEAIAATKKGVRIVNCARGGLVDEVALRTALDFRPRGRGRLRCLHRGAGGRQSPVRPPQRGVHAASRRRHHRSAGKRRAADRRADVRTTCCAAAISNAVNFPSITAEEAPGLRPFVTLAEKLGSFAGQLTETGIKKVQLSYDGEVAHMNTRALDLGGDRRPAAADAAERQRRLRGGRRQGARHRGRGDHAGGRVRL